MQLCSALKAPGASQLQAVATCRCMAEHKHNTVWQCQTTLVSVSCGPWSARIPCGSHAHSLNDVAGLSSLQYVGCRTTMCSTTP